MYEYKFVKLDFKGFFELKTKQDYHLIIEKHAREDWRLVQVLTPPTGISGSAAYFEIIFERQTK